MGLTCNKQELLQLTGQYDKAKGIRILYFTKTAKVDMIVITVSKKVIQN